MAKKRYNVESDKQQRYFSEEIGELAKNAKGLEDVYARLAMNSRKVADSTEKAKDNFQDQLNIGKKLFQAKGNILKHDIQSLDLSTDIAKAKKDEKNNDLEGLRAMNSKVKVLQKIQREAQKQVTQFDNMVDSVTGMVNKLPIIGDLLGGPISGAASFLKDVYAEGLGELIKSQKFNEEFGETMKNSGKLIGHIFSAPMGLLAVGLGTITALVKAGRRFGASISDINIGMLFFADQTAALSEHFGNLNAASVTTLFNMKLMELTTGVTSENQAAIMAAMAATSDSSLQVLQSQLKTYRTAGVPFKMVMNDVAQNTDLFAKFSRDGGDNIFRAAIKARELGVNLGDVSTITESILNFESSIEAQMQASVVLGRNINFDRARQLAFAGKQSEMMDEILTQVGGEAEFNKMSFIQRKLLADSVGLTVDRMSALVRQEEKAEQSVLGQYAAWIGIGAAVGGILGMIAGGTRNTLVSAKGLATGGLSGAVIGASVVGGGAMLANTVQNDFVQRPGQAPTPFSPDDTIIGVKGAGGGDKMIGLMERLVESNNKVVSEVRNLGLGSV